MDGAVVDCVDVVVCSLNVVLWIVCRCVKWMWWWILNSLSSML